MRDSILDCSNVDNLSQLSNRANVLHVDMLQQPSLLLFRAWPSKTSTTSSLDQWLSGRALSD